MRLNNITTYISTYLVNECLLYLKNIILNHIKLNIWEFLGYYLLLFMKSNKITLENFIKIIDILVKDFLNLKYTNIIYLGSIYCYLNNIKIFEMEMNFLMYISIILSLKIYLII